MPETVQNLKKLQKKYDEDARKCNTLQGIVETEIAEGTTKAKNSATDALLWLKRFRFVSVNFDNPFDCLADSLASSRALEFVRVFLERVLDGEQDLTKCAKVAYEASLKRFHGWIVQGIFSVS